MAENPHYKELLQLLNESEVEYLIVGGFAVMKYGEPRYTKDLDVWVDNSRQNSLRVVEALKKFGAGIGESADAVWKTLNTQHQKLFSATTGSSSDVSSTIRPDALFEPQFDPACIVEAAIDTSVVVAFGQRPQALSGRRRRPKPTVPEQASLFSLN
jgi:hypothetical protein